MEKSIEFRLDTSLPVGHKRVGLMDSRFRAATAQFIAAGSFGLTHFTLKPWMNRNQAAVLNRAFDLSASANCLYDLASGSSKEKDALALTAAMHSFNYRKPSCNPCDQVDWTRRWAQIIEKFNSANKMYKVNGSGLSENIRIGIEKYDAR